MRFGISLIAIVTLAVVPARAGAADEKAAPGEKPAAAASGEKPAQPGSTVFIDPVTKKVRQPTAAELQQLVSPGGRATAPQSTPVPLAGPGGAVGVRLGPNSGSYMVVTKTPDGKLVMDCVEGGKAAADRVTPPDDKAGKPAPRKSMDDKKE